MTRQLQVLLLTCAIAPLAPAQLVFFGAKGGVPFLDQFSGQDESRPYIIGPFVEFRLPAGFAVEADALYRRIGASTFFPPLSIIPVGAVPPAFPAVISRSDRLRGNDWEFSLLGKYYFRRRSSWQPYLGTGYAFRTIGVHQDISQTVLDADGNTHDDSFRVDSRADLDVGATAAVGVRFHVSRFAITPEIRYTHWGHQNNIFLRNNEVAVMLGISF